MTEPTTATRLSDEMIPLIKKAFERHAGGDQIIWDAAPTLVPDPASKTLMGFMGIYAQMPGATLGTYVGMGHPLQPVVDADVIDDAVRQVIEVLRSSRSEQLATMQQQGEQAARSGRPAPMGGLILPGQ